MKKYTIYFLVTLLLGTFQVFGARIKKKTKPNVLVILADDMGWADIGYNNPDHVYTPNLDALAGAGVRLTNHYVMPQCTPTRIATFTGRYPGRFGRQGLHASNDQVFPVGIPTMATMMKEQEYRTYICGKWHMGSDPENGPNHHGFDESYGSFSGAVGMYDHRYSKGKYFNTWHRNHELIEGHENGTHATDLIASEVQKIIATEQNPFFLFATFHAPHMPLDERGTFVDCPTQLDPNDSTRWLNEDKIRWFNDPEGKIQSESDPEKRLLLAAVYHLDFSIGQIIKTLEKENKLENTMILFSSDNGPQVNWKGQSYLGDLHLTDFNQELPMRGSKLDVWEGGIHVPAFVYWKGTLKPKELHEKVHIVDWLPTLAHVTGVKDTDKYEFDGVDLSSILFKNKKLKSRSLYWIWHPKTNRWALRYEDWKIVHYGRKEPKSADDWELYNLKMDKKEENNIALENRKKREELHEMFLVQRAKDKK